MYVYRNSFGSSLVEIALLLMLIGLFLLVRATWFVITTFVKYYRRMALWIALAICVLLCIAGGLLAVFVAQGFLVCMHVGIVELLITCKVVDVQNRDTFMKEQSNLIGDVLHKSWWARDDEPIAA